jgi:hypothetical protein
MRTNAEKFCRFAWREQRIVRRLLLHICPAVDYRWDIIYPDMDFYKLFFADRLQTQMALRTQDPEASLVDEHPRHPGRPIAVGIALAAGRRANRHNMVDFRLEISSPERLATYGAKVKSASAPCRPHGRSPFWRPKPQLPDSITYFRMWDHVKRSFILLFISCEKYI